MDFDVIVIGGGAAGLGGAVALARSRRRVLVIDTGAPRNAAAEGVHNFLSREGMSPLDLVARGRDELAGYGGRTRTGEVVAARGIDGGFALTCTDGTTVTARRLLVTTGAVDELPDVPGLAARWGRDVVHCPYCHGWEIRDQKLVVLATSPLYLHHVLLFSQLTDDLTVLLHDQPEPDVDTALRLDALDVRVVAGRVAAVEVTDDRISGVRLEAGDVVPAQAVATASRVVARSAVLDGLGLSAVPFLMGEHEMGTYVPADPTGRTSVPGVWVAGNVASPPAQVMGSAAAGTMAGAMINMDLIETDLATKLAG